MFAKFRIYKNTRKNQVHLVNKHYVCFNFK